MRGSLYERRISDEFWRVLGKSSFSAVFHVERHMAQMDKLIDSFLLGISGLGSLFATVESGQNGRMRPLTDNELRTVYRDEGARHMSEQNLLARIKADIDYQSGRQYPSEAIFNDDLLKEALAELTRLREVERAAREVLVARDKCDGDEQDLLAVIEENLLELRSALSDGGWR